MTLRKYQSMLVMMFVISASHLRKYVEMLAVTAQEQRSEHRCR